MQDVVFKLEDGSKVTFKHDTKLVFKFNPYHDKFGRFTTSDGAVSFTYKPGASSAYDKAIAHEKEREAASVPKPEGNPENFKSKSFEELETLEKKLAKNGPKNISKEESTSLRRYASLECESFNKAIYTGTASKDQLDMKSRIDGTIDKCKPLSEDLKAYRGTGVNALGLTPGKVTEGDIKGLIGKEHYNPAFSSFSTRFWTAKIFGTPDRTKYPDDYSVVIETTFKKGKKVMPMTAMGYNSAEEWEVLPKSGQKLKFTGYDVDHERGIYLLKAEALN